MTPISQPFFALFNSSILSGTYASSSHVFSTLTSGIQRFADGFVEKVAEYTLPDGELPEQYSRVNGTTVSARHLTWSYAAALSTFAARDGYVPASWVAREAMLPEACTPSAADTAQQKSSGITVTFTVRADTQFGGMLVYKPNYS